MPPSGCRSCWGGRSRPSSAAGASCSIGFGGGAGWSCTVTVTFHAACACRRACTRSVSSTPAARRSWAARASSSTRAACSSAARGGSRPRRPRGEASRGRPRPPSRTIASGGSPDQVTEKPPLVVAVEMGLGHLRAADAVARALGQPLLHADRAPVADEAERALWARTRRNYERLSRLATLPGVGAPFGRLLGAITHIPDLHPGRDLSAPTFSTGLLERLVARGIGRGVLAALAREQAPLFTTFFATALAADVGSDADVDCLVTDTDLARAWVPRDPRRSRIRYFAASERAVRRLAAYGVPPERVLLTGFPLPDELLGGDDLVVARRHLARRLARLDPRGRFRR